MNRLGKYTEKDAAKDTDSSRKEVRESWHEARKDARPDEIPYKESGVKSLLKSVFGKSRKDS